MSKPFAAKLLHVYGQEGPHDDVVILGNRDGLTALRDTINRVLVGTKAQGVALSVGPREPMTSDGEGFGLVVMRDDTEWQEATWQAYALPYTNEDECSSDDALWPHRIWRDWIAGRIVP